MKNYTWVKGYKYTKVPTFFKSWDIFGFNLSIKSHRTVRRRVGVKESLPRIWDLYEELLTPKK